MYQFISTVSDIGSSLYSRSMKEERTTVIIVLTANTLSNYQGSKHVFWELHHPKDIHCTKIWC